jgi:hypothetical protein
MTTNLNRLLGNGMVYPFEARPEFEEYWSHINRGSIVTNPFIVGDKVKLAAHTKEMAGSFLPNITYTVKSLNDDYINMVDDEGRIYSNYWDKFQLVPDSIRGNCLNALKDYFMKHKDSLFTIGIVILIDHFVFDGAFRDKIKATVESMLNKAHKKLEQEV